MSLRAIDAQPLPQEILGKVGNKCAQQTRPYALSPEVWSEVHPTKHRHARFLGAPNNAYRAALDASDMHDVSIENATVITPIQVRLVERGVLTDVSD